MTAAPASSGGTLRVAFAGTPEFAACALDAILQAGYEVPLVLTQPDRPSGRGMKLTPSAVKQLALARGIAVDQPEKLRTAEQRAALAACAPDVLVVAAYGLLLPPAVLALPRLGCINIHASLLPRWRGAAPIHRAIEAGDAETGVTIMQMDEGLDTGAMLLVRRTPILLADTTARLHDRLAALGGEAIVDALGALAAGTLRATPQPDEGVTYAAKIGRAEATIDWTRPAAAIERAVRAFDPFPGAVSVLRDSAIKCWAAQPVDGRGAPGTVLAVDDGGITVACGEGALRLLSLQRAGSKRLPAGEFLRGFAVCVGERFATASPA
ncbi:methionyl-tRNA formyltransferase [Thauera chlorobenzoica]|uniref:Methionyl-tRNA formyltransferase n=1 Tax=Thauera chlorobenzoica TaxID=96773 RepID=A0A1H5WW84_9RHOO|nr:methionyl-tRNA formyltransferase [Thauera chlorobenzoica]APR02956.1 methionyl-tRNA formyltransferase [Thauera chlorobenzoica]SEF82759.1 methionyl-tRNA formyltransferase [Thauera chlorobenzoica]SEG03869.1 methionyl-tRNA formyltransferase [Thauera chlorobenzoica]